MSDPTASCTPALLESAATRACLTPTQVLWGSCSSWSHHLTAASQCVVVFPTGWKRDREKGFLGDSKE